MKIAELKIIIETMENLGCSDSEILIDDSRDGGESYTECRIEARAVKGKGAVLVVL